MNALGPRMWGAALILILVTATGCYVKGRMDGKQLAQADQLKSVEVARMEEQRRVTEQSRIANEAKQDVDRARNEVRAANAVADKLRKRVADIASGHSAPASGSASTFDPIGLLADVLEQLDERAGALAEYADASRIAGTTCERSYEALTEQPQ